MQKISNSNPVPVQCGVAGYVSVYKLHKDKITGDETPVELIEKADKQASFKNLILNQGLDAWFINDVNSIMNTCRVGTGSSEPVVTQTGLDSELATTNTSTTSTGNSGGVPVWYSYYQRTYTFGLGAVVGNIAEIGIGQASLLCTRALIKDTEGDPTVISVTADEQLIVIYELRKYPPVDDVMGTLTIDVNGLPTDYSFTIRAANVDENTFCIHSPATTLSSASTAIGSATAVDSQTLAAVTGFMSGSTSSTTLTQASYTSGNFYRDYTAEFGISQGNHAGGIGGFGFFGSSASRYGFQVSVDPKIPKTADRILSLPLRLSWARV